MNADRGWSSFTVASGKPFSPHPNRPHHASPQLEDGVVGDFQEQIEDALFHPVILCTEAGERPFLLKR
jgi:hypothetical protein